jgi:hypothetical protein
VLEYLLAYLVRVDTHTGEHLHRTAVVLADEAKENVLGTDVVLV